MYKFRYIVENSGVEKEGGILPSDSE
jgi:hypothetical protein